MAQLTEKDEELAKALTAHFVETGFYLSLGEAAEAMGMSKGSVISDMFKRLEADGAIEYSSNRKQYRLSNWRAVIIGETPKPEPVVDAAAMQERIDKAVKKAVKEALATVKTDALERIREQNKRRAQAFRDRKRVNK